ncbi:hypothetical protein CT721_01820 [Listeria monocytogenes]|uniref:hypothetical protein n=1 Tax=Listeria seeligeri TaxID=1640 RepID=UPI0016262C61|nr:hypothetical protein [Listeria seeligeri]EAF3529888.1 hypothetical protein [Listeria monocytogenes]EAF8294241.1 hypothetical protein [Listeria monocytogenes]MBC2248318.1 hypothetical protein [Listeria seeligeri]
MNKVVKAGVWLLEIITGAYMCVVSVLLMMMAFNLGSISMFILSLGIAFVLVFSVKGLRASIKKKDVAKLNKEAELNE